MSPPSPDTKSAEERARTLVRHHGGADCEDCQGQIAVALHIAKIEAWQEGSKHAQAILDLSCVDGLYWSWSPAEREAWEWLALIAAAAPPRVETKSPEGR